LWFQLHLNLDYVFHFHTHYKLALAYEYSGNLSEAIDHSSSTITVLKRKVMALKQGASVADSEEKGKTPVAAIDIDPESEAGKEIKEIEDLIPDMELKVREKKKKKKKFFIFFFFFL